MSRHRTLLLMMRDGEETIGGDSKGPEMAHRCVSGIHHWNDGHLRFELAHGPFHGPRKLGVRRGFDCWRLFGREYVKATSLSFV